MRIINRLIQAQIKNVESDCRRSTYRGCRIALHLRTDNAKPTPIRENVSHQRKMTGMYIPVKCVIMRIDNSHIHTLKRREPRRLPWQNILIFRGHLSLLSPEDVWNLRDFWTSERSAINAFYVIPWSPWGLHGCKSTDNFADMQNYLRFTNLRWTICKKEQNMDKQQMKHQLSQISR